MDEQSGGASGSPCEPAPTKKKTYAPPVLVTWGTLRGMTTKVGITGALDGGKTTGKTKTR